MIASSPAAPAVERDALPFRLAVKLFTGHGRRIDPQVLIPVFHRWIQEDALDGQLIDVADYSHVHHGPGVMLIAHEGHYTLDDAEGQLGLRYERKRPLGGDASDRLLHVLGRAIVACRLLESDATFDPALRFRTDELELAITDRLLSPNRAETWEQWQPVIRRVLVALYGSGEPELDWRPSGAPFAVRARLRSAPDIATLATRLEALPADRP